MNKRITPLLLAVVMICSMLATAVPAYAAPGDSGVSASVTEASPGDTFTVTLKVPGTEKQISDMSLKVLFDNTVFEVTEYTIPSITGMSKMQSNVAEANSNAFFSATYDSESSDADITFTGIELTATFKVKDGAAASTYEFKLDTSVVVGSLTDAGLPDLLMTYDDFVNKSASVQVTAAPVSVTGVTIDETLSVNIGQTKTPSFTVAPAEATNKTVSFTSDNPAVATVNATTGEVTGVSKGTATITVKTADGNFTDTCTVTVSCAHTNKSTVPSQDSTCTEKGWDEHKKCDDCGQLFDTSDVEIDEVPFLNLADHTGGTATCTTKAVCSVCHQPYGNYANHSYTAETKKQEALKTAGNCRDKAVYYYSCSECGNVEHNDAHTFEGDKDANTHVGGTSTVNASEPDHKNQVDGYTGDTKCLGCGEIIATGTSIPAGAHTPSSTWNSDGTYHWKECTTVGCGVVIDGSKAKHSSTGANVATCQHKAVCDVCNVEYGELAAHNPASGWTSDASGHWHACQTAGCTEKCDFATHTPDHQGHATEEYAIKCTECGYVIEAQLGHTHDVDTTKYESDETNHWNTCSGCGEKQNVSAHEFEWKIDKEATATEKGSKHEECKVCGYKKAAVEIPATGTPTDPTPENPDSPPTGDNSMMALWIAVLFLSGFGVVTTAVYGKKRHSVK